MTLGESFSYSFSLRFFGNYGTDVSQTLGDGKRNIQSQGFPLLGPGESARGSLLVFFESLTRFGGTYLAQNR
jgi:hypothetical protein